MSSDDSGFDKEAEREKLREKYGDEESDRENTRRMSELLLQGATMTGKHCDECGDPIFRYDGREFCPTCQHEAQQAQNMDGDATQDAGTADRAAADSPETADATDTADRAAAETDAANTDAGDDRQTTDDEPRVEINDVRVADRHADPSNVRRPPSQTGGRGDDRGPETDRASEDSHAARGRGHSRNQARAHDHRHAQGATDREATARTSVSDDAGDLASARESLVRTLSNLARRAEETDDAGHARELLAATREAAEALAALDRANR